MAFMVNYIFSSTNKTDLSLPGDSDQDFNPNLIPVALAAIAAFAKIGSYFYQNWNKHVYEKTFALLQKQPTDPFGEIKSDSFEQKEPASISKNSDFLPDDFSKVWETFVNESSSYAPEKEHRIENPSKKLPTYLEAVEKYRESIKKYQKGSSDLTEIKKKLKTLPKGDASRGSLALQLKEAEQKLKALDNDIKNAYRERTEALTKWMQTKPVNCPGQKIAAQRSIVVDAY